MLTNRPCRAVNESRGFRLSDLADLAYINLDKRRTWETASHFGNLTTDTLPKWDGEILWFKRYYRDEWSISLSQNNKMCVLRVPISDLSRNMDIKHRGILTCICDASPKFHGENRSVRTSHTGWIHCDRKINNTFTNFKTYYCKPELIMTINKHNSV